MLSQLPEKGSVSLLLGVLHFAILFGVAVTFFGVMLVIAMGRVLAMGTVLLMQGLGFFPRMTLAGNRGKEESGGSSGEEGGQFHAGPDVADRPGMASEHRTLPSRSNVQCGTFDGRCSPFYFPTHFEITEAARR